MDNNKKVKRNLILPTEFLQNWISKKDDGSFIFKYIDFHSDNILEIELENTPFIELLFSQDDSFDLTYIKKRFTQISLVAIAIVDKRIKKSEEKIKLTGKEVLFLKYFYFLITILNGEYKFRFYNDMKKYKVFDILDDNLDKEFKNIFLSIISYILFELYDYIFTPRIFESLYDYVEKSNIDFKLQEFNKQIIIPTDILKTQNYNFLEVYFHNIVNNTFLKFFNISEIDRENFLLTNKTIANFIDQKTKINILSCFVIDPKWTIGLVNLGPGRGEYRPLFKYLSQNKLNTSIIPFCLKPEHQIEQKGIYLSDQQNFYFKPFQLTDNQVKLINDCLTFRDLKSDIDSFIKI